MSPVSKSSIRFPLGYSYVKNDLSWSAGFAFHSVLSSSEGLYFHGECPTAFPRAGIFSFFFFFFFYLVPASVVLQGFTLPYHLASFFFEPFSYL
ncbi:hypothetical protein Hanom_Chr07g00670261 [Helianthus anomalus]